MRDIMNNKKQRLDVIYHTDLEIPEIIKSGCARINVESLDDVLTDEVPGFVNLVQTNYYLNALGQVNEDKKQIIYMLGYIVPASEVIDDPDKYRLFSPERFVDESENDLAAIYVTPSGKTRVLDWTDNVRVFTTSEELKEAVYEFTQMYLEAMKGRVRKEDLTQKVNVKRFEQIPEMNVCN